MTYKEVGNSERIQADNEKYGELMTLIGEGNHVEGIYQGYDDCPGFKGKGKAQSHKFKQADGSILKMRGFGLMDSLLEKEVKEGDDVRVTYMGKGEEYHKCKVAIDDGKGGTEVNEDL